MQKNVFIQTGSTLPWTPFALMGLLLIGFGLFIIAFPEILVALVAGLFIFLGFTILFFSLRLRAISKLPEIF